MKASHFLAELLLEHGRGILKDATRLEGMLLNHIEQNHDLADLHLFLLVLKLGIPQQMLHAGIVTRTIRAKFRQQLCAADPNLTPEQAVYAIEAWAVALRLDATDALATNDAKTNDAKMASVLVPATSLPMTRVGHAQLPQQLEVFTQDDDLQNVDIPENSHSHLVIKKPEVQSFWRKCWAFLTQKNREKDVVKDKLQLHSSVVDTQAQPVWVDESTGLMWSRVSLGQTWQAGKVGGEPRTLMWCSLQKHIDQFDLCGYTDWRLPTIDELRDLMHLGNQLKLSNSVLLKHELAWVYYWSSSFYEPSKSAYVWCADFKRRETSMLHQDNVAAAILVRYASSAVNLES